RFAWRTPSVPATDLDAYWPFFPGQSHRGNVESLRPLVGAGGAFAVASGARSAVLALAGGADVRAAAAAAILSAAIDGVRLLAASIALAALLDHRRTKRALRAMTSSLAGGRTRAHFWLGIVLAVGALSGSIGITSFTVSRTAAASSAQVVALVT